MLLRLGVLNGSSFKRIFMFDGVVKKKWRCRGLFSNINMLRNQNKLLCCHFNAVKYLKQK